MTGPLPVQPAGNLNVVVKLCPIDGGLIVVASSDITYQQPPGSARASAATPTADDVSAAGAVAAIVSYAGTCSTCGSKLAWQENFQVLSR